MQSLSNLSEKDIAEWIQVEIHETAGSEAELEMCPCLYGEPFYSTRPLRSPYSNTNWLSKKGCDPKDHMKIGLHIISIALDCLPFLADQMIKILLQSVLRLGAQHHIKELKDPIFRSPSLTCQDVTAPVWKPSLLYSDHIKDRLPNEWCFRQLGNLQWSCRLRALTIIMSRMKDYSGATVAQRINF